MRQAHRPFREAEFLRALGRPAVQVHVRFAQPIGQNLDFVEFDAEGGHDAQAHAQRLADSFFGCIARGELFRKAAARFDLSCREAAIENALAVALNRGFHARHVKNIDAGG